MSLRRNKYLEIKRYFVNPEIKGLEGKRFVYFLLKNGVVVYIGSTENIEQRISYHKSGLWLDNWFDLFRFIRVRTYKKLLMYEKRWISKFKPEYNGGKKKRPLGSVAYKKWLRLSKNEV